MLRKQNGVSSDYLTVRGHSRASSGSREFREATKQDALNNLQKELSKLVDKAPSGQQEIVRKEMDGFAALFERFLKEEGPSVDWDRMEKLPGEAVRDYATLETPTTELVHRMLQKLVVVKLNGGLGTSMGCHGPKLAPMVRVGTLPMRLLALDYGADIVYTEELIDWKFLRSVRRVNDVLGTVDYLDKTDGTVIFRTCDREKERVVLQLGTCDPNRALLVAKMVESDVAGVDINMGCPKEFSLKGGMGAALLGEPEKARRILRTLVENVAIPITCKIRVLESEERTIDLVKGFVSAGVAAIAVHGRTKEERPRHANRNSAIRKIAESVDVPIIANGGSKDILTYDDIEKFRLETGSSSVMIARAAQANCSIFRKEGLKELDDVIVEYLKYAVDYDNAPSNTKYCVQNMLKELQESPRGKKFLECQTLEQICSIWNLGEYCRTKQLEYQEKGILGRREVTPDLFNPSPKKRKLDDDDTITSRCAFVRAAYPNDPDLPKSRLMVYCNKHKLKPTYETVQEDKLFRSVLTLDGKKYSSTFWEKNKKFAEQGAAIVCLLSLGIVDRESLIKEGSLLS